MAEILDIGIRKARNGYVVEIPGNGSYSSLSFLECFNYITGKLEGLGRIEFVLGGRFDNNQANALSYIKKTHNENHYLSQILILNKRGLEDLCYTFDTVGSEFKLGPIAEIMAFCNPIK